MDLTTLKAYLKKYGSWLTAASALIAAAAFYANGDSSAALNSVFAALAALGLNFPVHAQVNGSNSAAK